MIMQVAVLKNGKRFEAPVGMSVLDAAASAGLTLEHSCRTGRCGACKVRVLKGCVRPTQVPDLALTSRQREKGYMLSCVNSADSDTLVLDAEDLGRLADIRTQNQPARIHAINRPLEDVAIVLLRLPPGQALRYLPGQHIQLIGPGGVRRAYSLANAPRADGMLELQIRRVKTGVLSAYWFGSAKVGDLLRLQGPRGSFFFRDVAGRDLVLLATGTGVAPLKAMLEDLAIRPATEQPRLLTLYWGARRSEDFYYDRAAIRAWHPALRFVPVASREGQGIHVQRSALLDVTDWSNVSVYACGSPAMIADARISLVEAGLDDAHFFSDAFVSA
jgi:CDP-4-dehydro-6-deoxyglucose reductase